MGKESDIFSFERNMEIFSSIVKAITTQCIPCPEKQVQVTLVQMQCLQFINAHDKVLIGDIAKSRGISYPAATKAISRLEEKGLVVREHDPADRRNIFVRLTDCGRILATQILPERLRRMRGLLDEMPEDKRQALKEGMAAFLKVALTDRGMLEQVCLHCGKDHDETCVLYEIKLKCQNIKIQDAKISGEG